MSSELALKLFDTANRLHSSIILSVEDWKMILKIIDEAGFKLIKKPEVLQEEYYLVGKHFPQD